jgi:hypothetical protein
MNSERAIGHRWLIALMVLCSDPLAIALAFNRGSVRGSIETQHPA